MIIKTRVFEYDHNGYKNLTELAQAMVISVSQIYRVREGNRHINQKFIIGALKAFPKSKLDDPFYLVPSLSTVHNSRHHKLAIQAADEPAIRIKQTSASIR